MGNVDGKELWLPIANLVSICALLIWYPANPNDTITRLLFPGSTPQHKIFKGLEKLKRLECLKQPVCSPSSIQNSKSSSKIEKRKKLLKSDNKNILPDNAMIEKKEKMAKKRLEKLRKEKEEREKQEKDKREEKEKRDKEKEELENRERKEKEKERLEKRKKADREKKEKERQVRKEREAAVAAAKKEKEEKEAAAKKEKDEKDAAARKEREALRKEKEEKEANRKKEREAKVQKDLENKKEMSDPKSNDVLIKKKVSSSSTKSRLKETSSKTKSNETAISSRKIMPSKPTTAKHTTPPPSKLKKDENNKKVMENRKAAVAAKTHRSKPNNDEKVKVKKVINKKPINNDEGKPVNQQSITEKVSKAIASGEIDNSRLVVDEEDKESVVEKDQIEEMETSPADDMQEDEEDIELQRIKDDEEEENQIPVPDIGEKMAVLEQEIEPLQEPLPINNVNKEEKENERPLPAPLRLEKEKVPNTHVKTPDEVDELPEHEVVAHDINITEDHQSDQSPGFEEKIALDENEKETKDISIKSEASIEAVRDNEIVEVAVEQKVLMTDEPSPVESDKEELCIEKEELESNEKDSKNKVEIHSDKEDDVEVIPDEKDEQISDNNKETQDELSFEGKAEEEKLDSSPKLEVEDNNKSENS